MSNYSQTLNYPSNTTSLAVLAPEQKQLINNFLLYMLGTISEDHHELADRIPDLRREQYLENGKIDYYREIIFNEKIAFAVHDQNRTLEIEISVPIADYRFFNSSNSDELNCKVSIFLNHNQKETSTSSDKTKTENAIRNYLFFLARQANLNENIKTPVAPTNFCLSEVIILNDAYCVQLTLNYKDVNQIKLALKNNG